jgi:hypothetical protein
MYWSIKLPCIDDVIVNSITKVFLQLSCSWSDKHIRHEKGVIGSGADHPTTDGVFWIPPDITIYYVKLINYYFSQIKYK